MSRLRFHDAAIPPSARTGNPRRATNIRFPRSRRSEPFAKLHAVVGERQLWLMARKRPSPWDSLTPPTRSPKLMQIIHTERNPRALGSSWIICVGLSDGFGERRVPALQATDPNAATSTLRVSKATTRSCRWPCVAFVARAHPRSVDRVQAGEIGSVARVRNHGIDPHPRAHGSPRAGHRGTRLPGHR